MSKDVSKEIKDFSKTEIKIDWAFENFEKFIDYKQEAWYDETPIQVIKELQGEKQWPWQFLDNLEKELTKFKNKDGSMSLVDLRKRSHLP